MTDDDARTDPAVRFVDEAAARASVAEPSLAGLLDDGDGGGPTVDEARHHLHEAWAHVDAGTALPEDARMRQVKRAVLLALRPVTSHQVPFNQQIIAAARGLGEAVDHLANRVDAADRALDARVQASLATTELALDDLVDTAAGLQATVDDLQATVDDLSVRNQRLEHRLAEERAELRALRARQDIVSRAARDLLGGDGPTPHLGTLSRQLDASHDRLYEHLENAFRGSRDHVRSLAEGYLPDVEPLGGGPVLDIGCGRGEWLEALRDHDIDAYGFDTNEAMVERCRERGLDARVGDALAHLAEVPESSLAAVTGTHVAEHLTLDSLVELIDRARVALRPGGLLILETPNPTNLNVGAASFYLDPTHLKPLHPELLEFLVLERGFAEVELRYLHPDEDVNRLRPEDLVGVDEVRAGAVVERINWALFGPLDYAVLARKPAPPRPGVSRRIGLLKPDFGVAGGFERVVDRVEATLRADGHDVTRVTVPVDRLPHRPFGLEVPDDVWAKVPEYFRYLASIEAFERIDTRRFEVVLSTQPPSFANRHPRHLSLFFHHHRIFYDLEEVYLAAGFSAAPSLHRRAATHVRALDRPRLDDVAWFLAGSEAVRARLARFGGINRVGLFSAGVGVAGKPTGTGRLGRRAREPHSGRGAVLCVSRHEFPKRTELFVHAMKHLPHLRGASVGSGGRMAWARAVDHRLSSPGADLGAVTDAELWCNTGLGAPPVPRRYQSNVALLGRVDDSSLGRLYRQAPCVVAPAYEEDYGLTAVEAMSHGVPVVVCRDGGGLTSLVDHEVDGLVVEPSGPAIAAAVERVVADPDLRDELSAGATATAARITWARADDQLRAGLAEVLA